MRNITCVTPAVAGADEGKDLARLGIVQYRLQHRQAVHAAVAIGIGRIRRVQGLVDISANLFLRSHSTATGKGEGVPFDTPPAAATQGEGEGIGKAFEHPPPHPE